MFIGLHVWRYRLYEGHVVVEPDSLQGGLGLRQVLTVAGDLLVQVAASRPPPAPPQGGRELLSTHGADRGERSGGEKDVRKFLQFNPALPGVMHGQARHGLEGDLVPAVALAGVDGAVHVPGRPLAGRATTPRGLETRPDEKVRLVVSLAGYYHVRIIIKL